MRTYPKIETLFDRDARFKVDTTKLRRPVFGIINEWVVTEKIDGTNMRIHFDAAYGSDIKLASIGYRIAGKTENASIPPRLLIHCTQLAERIMPTVAEIMQERKIGGYTLFGEGYGDKIQKNGHNYRPDQGFILFDVAVGNLWLSEQAVTDTAAKLDIPRVPILGDGWTTDEIIDYVENGITSEEADRDETPAEGVVAKTIEPLYDNRGERIMWKLKTKDFA